MAEAARTAKKVTLALGMKSLTYKLVTYDAAKHIILYYLSAASEESGERSRV